MKIDSLSIALLVTMVGSALATIMTARVLRSALLLAVTSAVLAVLMYRLGAPIAAVFELSVCAGLIPAIFISAIGMTSRLSGEELKERQQEHWRRFGPLPGVVILVGVLLAIWQPDFGVTLPTLAGPSDVGEVLWNHRHADLLGQVTVLLAGAMAVVVLVKELRND
jgi:NADH-quinone oxidoreductase subunit J